MDLPILKFLSLLPNTKIKYLKITLKFKLKIFKSLYNQIMWLYFPGTFYDSWYTFQFTVDSVW